MGLQSSHGVYADHITFAYGSHVALDDVTFEAPSGLVTGLVGPNGAGKTTLIRILTTILPLQSGSLMVAGHRVDEARDIRRVTGVLPESGGYPGRKTALDYLVYIGALHGIGRTDASARAVRLLGEVGLGDRAADQIRTLSRGMRQRLGIARALMNDPAILFLDEPTLGLDPAGQRSVLDLVEHLASERGVTIILTSHLLDDVERVCERVVVLDHGRVAASGTMAGIVGTAAKDSFIVSVAPHDAGRVEALLGRLAGVTISSRNGGGRIVFTAPAGGADASINEIAGHIIGAGIPVLGLEAGTTDLTDAFMEITST